MRPFNQVGGITVAAVFGLLALALFLAVTGLTFLSSQNRVSTQTQASKRDIIESNLALTVDSVAYKNGKTDITITWRAEEEPASCKGTLCPFYGIAVRSGDGAPGRFNDKDDRLVKLDPKKKFYTMTLDGMTLKNGPYFVAVRYIPPEGPVKRDIQKFKVRYEAPVVMDKRCYTLVFYKNMPRNRAGSYDISDQNAISDARPGEKIVVYVPFLKYPGGYKGTLTASLVATDLVLDSVDSDLTCRATDRGFTCREEPHGAARYKLAHVATGKTGNLTLNYTVTDASTSEVIKCGPFSLKVFGSPPP